jgi:outer membrane protein assembly factor BamB
MEVTEDTVYIGSYAGSLYAVDAVDGTKQWENVDVNSSKNIRYLGVDKSHVFAADSHCIRGVSRNAGVTQWQFDLGEGQTPLGALVDDKTNTIYVGNKNSEKLLAIDTVLETQKWSFSSDSGFLGPLTVANEMVLIGGESGELYAVDVTNGNQRWRSTVPEGSHICIGEESIYACSEGYLTAVETATGTQQWEFEFDFESSGIVGPNSRSLAVGEEMVFVGSDNGDVLAVSPPPTDGCETWQSNIDEGQSGSSGGNSVNSMCVRGEIIYVGTHARGETNTLCAVDAGTGAEQWRFETQGEIKSIRADDETVYAFTPSYAVAVATGSGGGSDITKVYEA